MRDLPMRERPVGASERMRGMRLRSRRAFFRKAGALGLVAGSEIVGVVVMILVRGRVAWSGW